MPNHRPLPDASAETVYRRMPALLPEERRALEALAPRGAWCRLVGATFVVVARKNGVSLRVASIPAAVVEKLRRRKWIAPQANDALVITAAGRQALNARPQPVDFQAASHNIALQEIDEGKRVLVNRDESGLSRIARMKKPDGAPFLDHAAIAAGERLGADIMRAGMVPGVTMRWDATGSSGDHRAHPAELTLAARQRVEAALDFVGHEFAGLLIDLLAFSKGVEDIERERRWPQRSGKIFIAMALARLAHHYGYAAQARGADVVKTRVWHADGARPAM